MTPFALAFGAEAIIPAEVAVLSYRTSQKVGEDNDQTRKLNLDILEEH